MWGPSEGSWCPVGAMGTPSPCRHCEVPAAGAWIRFQREFPTRFQLFWGRIGGRGWVPASPRGMPEHLETWDPHPAMEHPSPHHWAPPVPPVTVPWGRAPPCALSGVSPPKTIHPSAMGLLQCREAQWCWGLSRCPPSAKPIKAPLGLTGSRMLRNGFSQHLPGGLAAGASPAPGAGGAWGCSAPLLVEQCEESKG